MRTWILFSVLLLPVSALAQVRADVNASDFLGSGVGITLYRPTYNLSAGLGYFENHIVVGLADSFVFHGYDATVGTSFLGLSIEGGAVTIGLTGLQVSKSSDDTKLQAFLGASGPQALVASITTVRPGNFAAGALYGRKTHNIWFSGLGTLDTGKFSALGSASYHSRNLYWSGTAGLLNGQKFLNGGLGYRTDWFSVMANHQSWFAPYPVTGDSINGSIIKNWFLASASVHQSRGHFNVTGESAGIGFRFGPVTETSTYYRSTNSDPYLYHTVTERIGKFSFSQNLLQENGQNSYSFGGGYASNRLSVSVTHQIQFLLNGAGFKQVTSVQFSFRIHDTVVQALSITNPYGKLLWSAGTQSYIQTSNGSETGQHSEFQKYIIEGTCKQPDGSVVEGCVLEIEQTKAASISNAQGQFEFREKKNTPLKTRCPDEFAGLGAIKIVSCPAVIEPNKPFVMVVRREESHDQ